MMIWMSPEVQRHPLILPGKGPISRSSPFMVTLKDKSLSFPTSSLAPASHVEHTLVLIPNLRLSLAIPDQLLCSRIWAFLSLSCSLHGLSISLCVHIVPNIYAICLRHPICLRRPISSCLMSNRQMGFELESCNGWLLLLCGVEETGVAGSGLGSPVTYIKQGGGKCQFQSHF